MNNGFYPFPKNKTTASSVFTLSEQEAFVKYTLDNYVPNFDGEIVEGAIHSSVSQFNLVYCDVVWRPVDQTTDSSTYLLGIYLGNNQVLLEGSIVVTGDGSPNGPYINGSISLGLPVYIRQATTTGEISCSIPSAKYIRILGHCYYNSTINPNYYIMKFKPSNDWLFA